MIEYAVVVNGNAIHVTTNYATAKAEMRRHNGVRKCEPWAEIYAREVRP